MLTPSQMLCGLIIPAVVAGVLAIIGWHLPRRSPWGAIIAVPCGLVLAYRGLLNQWPPIWPKTGLERIVIFAIPLGIVAFAASWKSVPRWVRATLAVFAPAAMLYFVFSGFPASTQPQPMWEWIVIPTFLAMLIVGTVETIAVKRQTTTLIFGPLAGGAGAIIMLTGNLYVGSLCAAVALMILAWFIISLFDSAANISRGPVWVCVTLVTGAITYGYFDQPEVMTKPEFALLCIAPLLAWIADIPPISRWKPWRRELLRFVLVVIPIAIAVAMAVIQFRKDSANNSGVEM